MRAFTVSLILLFLTGCGTTAGQESPEKTGFIMVSRGNASLLYRAFVGGVDYCKAVQHNLSGVEFTGDIRYDGEVCTVEITASD